MFSLSFALVLTTALGGPPVPATTNLNSAVIPVLPPSSLPKPPVERFRQLLAMDKAQRQQWVANHSSPENQERLAAKLQEYEALSPEERELRLRVTELRWYLLPLLRAPATNRTEQLAAIPADIRPLVEERLQRWDLLPPGMQQEFLENQAMVAVLAESQPAVARTAPPNPVAVGAGQVQPGLARWQSMSEDQRQRIIANVNTVFSLTEREKAKVLLTLSEPERLQIEKTLRQFEHLPPAQRAQCLRSVGKFASLSPQEREQFLKNAERWKQMTPSERQTWKDMVQKLYFRPPPDPREVETFPMPPRRPKGALSPSSVATNGN